MCVCFTGPHHRHFFWKEAGFLFRPESAKGGRGQGGYGPTYPRGSPPTPTPAPCPDPTMFRFQNQMYITHVCITSQHGTPVCWRHSARRLSTSSQWSLTWNGDGTETHSWCCTVPLFVPSLTMVALCMAQHQTPTCNNWTAFITLDWDWHWEHSAPAQCPACTQKPTKLLWRNVG